MLHSIKCKQYKLFYSKRREYIMKKEQSKKERFREYMKEMWRRYQCYYKYELDTSRMDCKSTGKSLRYYLKYSEEEIKAMEKASLAETRYVLDHWDEYLRLLEQERKFEEQEREEFTQKVKKIIFFWK